MKIGSFDTRQLSALELTRLRLTGWYLLIIMILSVLFSLAIFQLQSADLHHRFGRISLRFGNGTILTPNTPTTSEELIEEALDNLRWQLIDINIGILLISAGASYVLAGITLRPIKRSMDEQTRFIADASHEIRTPLTAMKTSTEVALRARRLDPKETRQLLQDNLRKINLLQGLTSALIDLVRSGEVERPLPTVVDLSAVARSVVREIHPQAQGKRIKVKLDLSKASVAGDRDELTRLLTILVDNAIKYTPTGGAVAIQTSANEGTVRLTVTDNGVGMTRGDLEHVFDRFYRADKSRTEPGFGLGLPIAQKIVQDYGGSIEITSREGAGTTVKIELPGSAA